MQVYRNLRVREACVCVGPVCDLGEGRLKPEILTELQRAMRLALGVGGGAERRWAEVDIQILIAETMRRF